MWIINLSTPGRFPTVSPDPGAWWSDLANTGEHELIRHSANFRFWRLLGSHGIERCLTATLSFTQRLRQRLEWTAAGVDLRGSARLANEALNQLGTTSPFDSAEAYIETIGGLVRHLALLNEIQRGLHFSLDDGVRVAGLNYDDSGALAHYAQRDTALLALVAASLEDFPADAELVLLSVTSPQDLLTALVAARVLRERYPELHICLADHGYENFSLHPHLATLRTAGTLTQLFDTIIEAKDDRDVLVGALVAELNRGSRPRGFLTRESLPASESVPTSKIVAAPPLPTFTPEPVMWTRISRRRCYWSRCAFCVQNVKYDDPHTPSTLEVPAAVARLKAMAEAGYRTFIFSDEALSPSVLRRLSDAIIAARLDIRWACRSKLELALTPELFAQMAEAGCYEVLYGLESISPRMQQRMDKYVAGLDAARVRRILDSMNDAGIGVHLNLIANFPGDTLPETTASVDFTINALTDFRNGTFLLNRFALFPDTPIAKSPESFGLELLPQQGDMPGQLPHRCHDAHAEEQIDEAVSSLRQRLWNELGWARWGSDNETDAALSLYFGSGHGAIFKARFPDVFGNPLHANQSQPLEALV